MELANAAIEVFHLKLLRIKSKVIFIFFSLSLVRSQTDLTVSLCISGCLQTHCMHQVGLELIAAGVCWHARLTSCDL